MRRLVLILFILLLPWRLWAGDAMALAVLHSAPAVAHGGSDAALSHAHAPAAAHSEAHGGSHSLLHPAVTQSLADNSACPEHATEAGGHGLCPLCGICHQALAAPLRLGALPTALPSSEPVSTRTMVLQAERQPELKPPIF